MKIKFLMRRFRNLLFLQLTGIPIHSTPSNTTLVSESQTFERCYNLSKQARYQIGYR